jgi:hypothetical protein
MSIRRSPKKIANSTTRCPGADRTRIVSERRKRHAPRFRKVTARVTDNRYALPTPPRGAGAEPDCAEELLVVVTEAGPVVPARFVVTVVVGAGALLVNPRDAKRPVAATAPSGPSAITDSAATMTICACRRLTRARPRTTTPLIADQSYPELPMPDERTRRTTGSHRVADRSVGLKPGQTRRR